MQAVASDAYFSQLLGQVSGETLFLFHRFSGRVSGRIRQCVNDDDNLLLFASICSQAASICAQATAQAMASEPYLS